jgi:hypothetical protein
VAARTKEFFDPERGNIVREALDLIEHYPVNRVFQNQADITPLSREYYRFYLELRRTLSRHLTEKVNLNIVEFAKLEEYLIKERIKKASEDLWSFFDAVLADYRRELLGPVPDNDNGREGPSQAGACAASSAYFPGAGRVSEAGPPGFSSYLERNGLGKGILFIKFGISSLPGVLAALKTRMGKGQGRENPVLAEQFRKARLTACSEAASELLRAFRIFSEDLKTVYFYRIVDEECIFLLEEFKTRAEMAHVDFAGLLKTSGIDGEEKRAALETLTRARQVSYDMINELEEIRREAAKGLNQTGRSATL